MIVCANVQCCWSEGSPQCQIFCFGIGSIKRKIVDDQSIYTVTLYVAETWKSSNPVSCLLSKRRHRSNRNDRIDLREKKDRGEAKEKVETGMIGDTSFLQCVGCKQIKVSELILLSRKFFLAQQCE